jgi:hypothetical protein
MCVLVLSREVMNSGDLVLEGYEEGSIGGIEWGDLVVEEYERGQEKVWTWVTSSLRDMKKVLL